MESKRIDVHTHLVPPFWAEELKDHGGDPSGWASPQWSPEQAISFMDAEGIQTGLLSLTAPGIEGWAEQERPDIARRVNDYGTALVKQNPRRFGYLATLPLPDVRAAIAEIDRCYDVLHVDGVVLHSNYEGTYLAEPVFNELWAALDDRQAVVFLHPTTPPSTKVLAGIPGPIEDYPAETTRSALGLVVAGHLTRYRKTKIILSHGGGFLPYAATRFAELKHSLAPDRSVDSLTADMKSFYFDTALTAPSGLPSLLAFAARGRVLFGTDYPYASEAVSKTFTKNLDEYQGFEEGELDEINRGAGALFSRLNDGLPLGRDRTL